MTRRAFGCAKFDAAPSFLFDIVCHLTRVSKVVDPHFVFPQQPFRDWCDRRTAPLLFDLCRRGRARLAGYSFFVSFGPGTCKCHGSFSGSHLDLDPVLLLGSRRKELSDSFPSPPLTTLPVGFNRQTSLPPVRPLATTFFFPLIGDASFWSASRSSKSFFLRATRSRTETVPGGTAYTLLFFPMNRIEFLFFLHCQLEPPPPPPLPITNRRAEIVVIERPPPRVRKIFSPPPELETLKIHFFPPH